MSGDWASRRVLVTGGTGFVGANLVRWLVAAKAKVFLLARPNASFWRLQDVHDRIEVLRGDLVSANDVYAAFAKARPEVVFHLATGRGGDAHLGYSYYALANVLGVANLIEAAVAHPVQAFISTGSSLEYGHKSAPHREEESAAPDTIHGATKLAATILIKQGAKTLGLAATILRLFHVYGPFESLKRLVPTAIRAALLEQPIKLTDSDIRRDYVFIGDVVEALIMAAENTNARGEIINIASGRQYSNEDLVNALGRVVKHSIKYDLGMYNRHATDTDFLVANISKARRILEWTPRHDLEAGLRMTVDWTIANPWAMEMAAQS